MTRIASFGQHVKMPQPMNNSNLQPTALQHCVLGTLRVLFRPIVRLSIAHGVKFQQLAELLKVVSLDVAETDLRAEGRRANASLLSVVTGLHRKDVNRLIRQRDEPEPSAGPSIESQVFTRWMTDAAFLDAHGRPRPLLRTGTPGPQDASFEALARSITSDVHPRAILESLQRLGMIAVDARDRVSLVIDRFVPSTELSQLLAFLRDNNHDHLAASVANAMGRAPPFLEQSLFADGLRAESVARLQERARETWLRLMREFVPLAERMVADDAAGGADAPGSASRVRLGLYFYSDLHAPRGASVVPAPAADVVLQPDATQTGPVGHAGVFAASAGAATAGTPVRPQPIDR